MYEWIMPWSQPPGSKVRAQAKRRQIPRWHGTLAWEPNEGVETSTHTQVKGSDCERRPSEGFAPLTTPSP